uniref:Cytochrome P450 n=2 Tax=Tetranychus urticae TaxID=32264 RepID=T1KC28_TETUR
MKYQKAYDGVFVFWLGWYPMVAITNHKAAEAVLSLPNHKKGEEYAFLGLEDGIVVSHGDKWKARRKMIEPFFNTKSLTASISGMNQAFNLMTNELKEKRIETIDMGENIHKRSLDIIMKSTMSVPIVDKIEYKKTAISDIEACETIALTRILNPALWVDAIFYQTNAGRYFKKATGRLMAFMEEKIVERINEKSEMASKVDEKEQKMRHDLIDLLVMHHDPNSKDVTQSIDVTGITEEILNLLVAGHDTISAGLRWTLFLLGNHLDWQEKIYEEISNNLDIDQDPETLEDINSLVYLDWCIKESMRLFPPIPLVTRTLEYAVETGKHTIPKGTAIVFSYYTIQRDEKIWDNPELFDPERFSPERFSKIPKYGYLPFGHGKRSCIGKRFAVTEMKIFIIHLMRHYSWVSTQKVNQVSFGMDVTTKPLAPLTIRLTPRNKSQAFLRE